jgi:hypothetical protein
MGACTCTLLLFVITILYGDLLPLEYVLILFMIPPLLHVYRRRLSEGVNKYNSPLCLGSHCLVALAHSWEMEGLSREEIEELFADGEAALGSGGGNLFLEALLFSDEYDDEVLHDPETRTRSHHGDRLGPGRGGGVQRPQDIRPYTCLYGFYTASGKPELILHRTGLYRCEIDSLADALQMVWARPYAFYEGGDGNVDVQARLKKRKISLKCAICISYSSFRRPGVLKRK